jgi:cytochrome c oxidase subunit IV
MEDNQRFSAEQSLHLIQSMIEKAKQDVANNSFYLLLWGWLIFIAALLNFGLMRFTSFEQPYLAWNLVWIGAIASIIKGVKDSKKIAVKTFVGKP